MFFMCFRQYFVITIPVVYANVETDAGVSLGVGVDY